MTKKYKLNIAKTVRFSKKDIERLKKANPKNYSKLIRDGALKEADRIATQK
jgi:hypothetical protein